jgi:peroxiredoxin/urease beta subunit
MLRALLITLFYFFTLSVFAQNISLSGKAETYKNDVIELVIVDDYISGKEKVIGTSTTDAEGRYSIKADLRETRKAELRIHNVAASLFIEPGKNYTVNIPPYDPSKEISGNINYVKAEIVGSKTNELNNQIADFNFKYDSFIKENYSLLITGSAGKKVKTFKERINKEYAPVTNIFFKDYILYSLAGLDQLTNASKKYLHKNYFLNKPILYSNPEYMNFFNQFFGNYLWLLSQSSKGEELLNKINNRRDYTDVTDYLRSDSLLASDKFRELVLIHGLREMYNKKEVNKKNVEYLLRQIKEKSLFTEHRLIADNVLYSLVRFSPGVKAPEFELINIKGEKISLEKYKGKFVYLTFWATWCSTCVNDMRTLQKLYEKYKHSIEFISISIDKKESDYLKTANKYNFPWQVAHFSSDRKIITDYEARALPAYFLIAPDGRFIDSSAPSPSENIEEKFKEIIKAGEKKINIGRN